LIFSWRVCFDNAFFDRLRGGPILNASCAGSKKSPVWFAPHRRPFAFSIIRPGLQKLLGYYIRRSLFLEERRIQTTRARAPLRLGFAGGGTDLSPYCDEFGGAVLNFTIDRFAYAFVSPRTDGKVVFSARDLDVEESFPVGADLSKARLSIHRGVYQRMMNAGTGAELRAVTVTTTVDAPPGSGLGSSSALVVALVDAFRAFLELPLGQYDVAHLAFEIERKDLGLSGGKQDQYAAAFGGLNFIEFLADDRVIVNPLRVATRIRNELESSLVICFSGRSRESAAIIDQQTTAMVRHADGALTALHQLKHDAIEMKRALLQGQISEMALILDRSWSSKKATASGVTNQALEDLYLLARRNGATGGKVSGAGGGGFMMFMTVPEERFRLVNALNAAGALASPVKFTETGCETWQI
jgi:D-glycero-alpha-D-manno-heptose-7-phosphate kinase